ncbi:cyclic lactone autoinducer peptide [Thermacetogenium phaeum]
MKRFFKVLSALYGLLAIVAAIGVKPACFWMWHQPEVPPALRK